MNADQQALRKLLDEAERAVVFTGAGISTESGIPDFRSPGGFWSKNTPIYFDEFMASKDLQEKSWRRKFESDGTFENAKPNHGHRAVANLVHMGKVSHVITQNVDNLHQVSGVPDEKVIELHGNSTYAKCLSCGQRYEIEPLQETYDKDGSFPSCDCRSDAVVKSATISFGQPMPEDEMRRADEATFGCDLFIAIGSSLVVFPAASFPAIAKRNGAGLVIINRDPTDMDEIADLVINDEIGPTLSAVVGLN